MIEESDFCNRKDVHKLLYKVKNLKNCNDEIKEKIINKAKELNIPINYREEFYNSKLELISFNNQNTNININDIKSLIGVSGIWSKSYIDKDGKEIYLDVAQTKDIGKEILYSLRAFDSNRDKLDSELKQDSKLGIRKKYRDMWKESKGKIIFKVIVRDVFSKEERELIEMQFAHDVKAKYWNPAPGQTI